MKKEVRIKLPQNLYNTISILAQRHKMTITGMVKFLIATKVFSPELVKHVKYSNFTCSKGVFTVFGNRTFERLFGKSKALQDLEEFESQLKERYNP